MPSWLQTHRKQALAGAAAVGVVGLALYSKHKAASSSTSSTGTTTSAVATPVATATPTTGGYYAGGYDDSGLDEYNQLESQIASLTGGGTIPASPAASTTTTQTSSPAYNYASETALPAGGYEAVSGELTVPAANGSGLYYDVQNPTQAEQLNLGSASNPTYWQPTPGVFSTSPAPPGTALYEKVG